MLIVHVSVGFQGFWNRATLRGDILKFIFYFFVFRHGTNYGVRIIRLVMISVYLNRCDILKILEKVRPGGFP